MKQLRTWFDTWHISSQLMFLVMLLNIIDFTTTMYLVSIDGYIVEANLFLRHLMEVFDTAWAILWAKLVLLGTAWGLIVWYMRHPKGGRTPVVVIPISFLVCAFSAVSVWNFYVIYQT